MASFFATSESSTAGPIEQGVIIAWGGGVIRMQAAFAPSGGARVSVAAELAAVSDVYASGGAAVPIAGAGEVACALSAVAGAFAPVAGEMAFLGELSGPPAAGAAVPVKGEMAVSSAFEVLGGGAAPIAAHLDALSDISAFAGVSVPVAAENMAFRGEFSGTPAGGAFVPVAAEMATIPALRAATGVQVPVASAMDAVCALTAATGASAPVAALMGAQADIWAFGGAVAPVETGWALASGFSGAPAGGGFAALVNDIEIVEQLPTAGFATTAGLTFGFYRQPCFIRLFPEISAAGGAKTPVEAAQQIIPNDHGPVARPRPVRGQIIHS